MLSFFHIICFRIKVTGALERKNSMKSENKIRLFRVIRVSVNSAAFWGQMAAVAIDKRKLQRQWQLSVSAVGSG